MNALTQIALAGTVKVTSDPRTGTPLDTMFGELASIERERALLLRAAGEATYTLAGHVAEPGVALPEPAPDEHQQVCSEPIARLVGDMLQERHAQVLPEALRLLAVANLRLPPTLLPVALGLRAHELRPALLPVLGERGRWLSRFNPEWGWASEEGIEAGTGLPPNAEMVWQEGTPAQRLGILGRMRTEQPALVRAWLEAAWREEKAEFRSDALLRLDRGLSRDDEPFLEKALDDRAQTVRTQAASLLAAIPESALVDRMRARVDPLLRYTPAAPAGRLRGLLRTVMATPDAAGTLSVTLPETFDKSWQRDGIVEKPPGRVGQRSWWLSQMLALVPPAHWEQRLGASPAVLITAASADDAGLAVLEGWSRAAIRSKAADWALLLWNAWDSMKPRDLYAIAIRGEMLATLVGGLPQHDVRSLALLVLKRTDLDGNIRVAILQALPQPWDVAFGNIYLDAAHRDSNATTWNKWHQTFGHAATSLPPACFERALRLFTPADDQPASWYVKPFLDIIQLRQRLYQEIRP